MIEGEAPAEPDEDALTVGRLEEHSRRSVLLAEAQARPFHPSPTPARFLHFAFTTDPIRAQADRHALEAFCRARQIPEPGPSAKHHRIALDSLALKWEQHTEFTTYTWELKPDVLSEGDDRVRWMRKLPQPGPLMVCIDLELVRGPDFDPEQRFGTPALAVSYADDEAALIATDFRPDADGFIRMLVVDRKLTPYRAGSLVQRLLELETYRMFALLGLPEAQRRAQAVTAMEHELADLSMEMLHGRDSAGSQALLQKLTGLHARLEAGATGSAYRFGASRAYAEIVSGRLEAIDEARVPGYSSFSAFMARRLAPAMRTCKTMERRQAELSRNLARATQLLRARIDIDLQQQNVELLASLDDRGRAHLRLQMMVETLSIAAASYYAVGLLEHVAKVMPRFGLRIDADLTAAVAVPVVTVLIAAFLIGRLRDVRQARGPN